MIYFGFECLTSAENNILRIGVSSRALGAKLAYGWNYWIPYIASLNAPDYQMAPLEQLVDSDKKFIFPLELRWEFLEYLSRTNDKSFLDAYIPDKVFDAIRGEQCHLVVSFAHEARVMSYVSGIDGGARSFYDDLLEFKTRHQLPSNRIWFLNGNINFFDEYQSWKSLRSLVSNPFQVRYADIFWPLMKFVRRLGCNGNVMRICSQADQSPSGHCYRFIDLYLEDISSDLTEFYGHANEKYVIDCPEKIILCLNNAPRAHRILSIIYLELLGLLDQSLVSLNINVKEANLISFENPDRQKAWDAIISKMPLRVDEIQLYDGTKSFDEVSTMDNSNMIGIYDAIPYRQAAFNIVNETITDPSVGFISEKTWKAIITCRPFWVVGTPNTLRFLKSRGFKTFDDFFDESYDGVLSIEHKIEKIFKSVLSIINNPEIKTDIWKRNVSEVLSHNLKNFEMSASDFEIVMHEISCT